MPPRRRPNGQCTICSHAERYQIELALVSGVSTRAIAKKFSVSRDAAWRHHTNHVPPERRTQLVAGPLKLTELAQKAADEGLALIDYLSMVRSVLLSRFLVTAEADDRPGTAMIAGRLLECLRIMAQLTGELTKTTANVTHNTLVLASPLMAELQGMLIRTLAAFPEARMAVLAGLEELSNRALQSAPEVPSLPNPSVIEVSGV
jgi:hypothetical protein